MHETGFFPYGDLTYGNTRIFEKENTMTGSAKPEVTLNDAFEGTVVRGGIRIEFNAQGGVDVYAPVPVMVLTCPP